MLVIVPVPAFSVTRFSRGCQRRAGGLSGGGRARSSAAGWLPGDGEFLVASFGAAAQVEVLLPQGLNLVVQRGDVGRGATSG